MTDQRYIFFCNLARALLHQFEQAIVIFYQISAGTHMQVSVCARRPTAEQQAAPRAQLHRLARETDLGGPNPHLYALE